MRADGQFADDLCLEPGLWVEEERLRARVTLTYLHFRGLRWLGRSTARVPAPGPARSRDRWLMAALGAWSLVKNVFLDRSERIYRVAHERVTDDASVERFRGSCCLVGKQNSLCFGRAGGRAQELVVYKVCHTRQQFDREARAREALARHFALPPHSADPARLTFREHVVPGRVLGDAAETAKLAAVNALADAYAHFLPRASAEPAPLSCDSLARHPSLWEVVRRRDMGTQQRLARALDWATGQPWVFCHNDLSGSNVILSEDDVPFLIDFERAAPNLFCADILWLVVDLGVRSGSRALHELSAGTFDAGLSRLWQAADREYTRVDLPLYVVAAVCAKTLSDVEALGPDCWSARTFEARLEATSGL